MGKIRARMSAILGSKGDRAEYDQQKHALCMTLGADTVKVREESPDRFTAFSAHGRQYQLLFLRPFHIHRQIATFHQAWPLGNHRYRLFYREKNDFRQPCRLLAASGFHFLPVASTRVSRANSSSMRIGPGRKVRSSSWHH